MNLAFLIIGTVLALLWFYLFIKYKDSHKEYVEAIEKGQYLLPGLFFIGLGFMDTFHIDVNSKYAQNRITLWQELKGKKYGKFHFYVNLAGEITYILTFSVIGIFIGVIADTGVAVLFVAAGIILAVYLEYDVKNKVSARREEIMTSLPHVLSKLSLLISAGMPLRTAIEKVAYAKEEVLYQEVGAMQDEIANGVSEIAAFQNLADRCGIQEVRKFSTMMIQNMEKGSGEMADGLCEMADNVWRDRKNNVRQIGEKASAKLMIPIIMIFLGIMLMVLAPMLSTISS